MKLKRGHRDWRCEHVDAKLRPFVGSDMTTRQVGALLGLTHVAVWKALKVRGWSLSNG